MASRIDISVEEKDFDISKELEKIKSFSVTSGAVVFFVGKVREIEDNKLDFLCIESFPEMAEKEIKKICEESLKQWKLDCVIVKHRHGKLKLNDNIVLVATSSIHRDKAYEASMHIMNLLKSHVPFWKKEITGNKENWVENNHSDSSLG